MTVIDDEAPKNMNATTTPSRRPGSTMTSVLLAWLLSIGTAVAKSDLPVDVFAASDSVLLAVSFAALHGKPQNLETRTIPPIDPTGLAPPFDRETRIRIQGAFCRMNGLERCPVFDGEAQGTAFALARSGEIVTCRHLVHDWIYWASVLNGHRIPSARLVPPIFLIDRSKAIVLSTWEKGYRALLFVDDRALMAPLARLADDAAFWDADLLAFRLASDRLPPPLERGDVPVAGDVVHAVGYASGTDGPKLHAIVGHVLRSQGIEIATDVATRPGMSGAPLLDEHGRAMAISCGRERGIDPRDAGALALPLDVDLWARELRDRRGMVPIVDPSLH